MSDSSASSSQSSSSETNKEVSSQVGSPYARYVLGVLVVVYIFNFIDRQILSILAEDIKADLGISDADIGFLYGTAFAIFYAVFGIPLGRLADTWTRKSLISTGLLFWSVMTALSGTARSFASLATFRIGVGIGEASATPAAFSMLSDYFEPKHRATALAVYSSGVYIGSGIGIFLGGVILDGWLTLYPDYTAAPMQLKGWHVAFFAVGLPGVLLAAWVATLKEPLRGLSEGIKTIQHPHPFKETWKELKSLLPILNLHSLWNNGAGIRGIVINLIGLAVICGISTLLIQITGSTTQWIALSIGVYAAFCWSQNLAYADQAAFAMIFGSKTILLACLAFPSVAFVTYGIGFWGPPFFQRIHGVSAAETGIVLGLATAIGGWAGVTLGGVLADTFRSKYVRAKFYVSAAAAFASIPPGYIMLTTDSLNVAYACNFVFSFTSPMWIGPAASTVNDLVMPRMRAIASAFYILMVTFIGLALGPYVIGFISDELVQSGTKSPDALRQAMMIGLYMLAFAGSMMLIASRFLENDENSRIDRAIALGENV